MKNKNQRNHLTDSSSDMGLTLRQGALKKTDTPHYFEVRNSDGERYCHCGSFDDVVNLIKMYPDFTWEKIYLPHTPRTVDVPHIQLAPDLELPAQQILPESELEPFIV